MELFAAFKSFYHMSTGILPCGRPIKNDGVFTMGRGLILWLLGIPLPVILILWLLGFLHG